MIDWNTLFAPIRNGFDQMAVTYVRDPSIALAILFTIPGVILGVLNAVVTSKIVPWLLGKLVALGAFFGIVGLTMCLVPVNQGLFFTRSQAFAAGVLVAICWGFVIAVHKLKARMSH